MDRKFYFLFLFLLLQLTSGVLSLEVNPQLLTNVTCSVGDNSCDHYSSFCNSAGMCQCKFGYSTNMSPDRCDEYRCPSTARCSELYTDSNVTCGMGSRCHCFDGFRLDSQTQKCVLEKPTVRLGDECIADHQCGKRAECSTSGECGCPVGTIRETAYTCAQPLCSSDEFCHFYFTNNTVCTDRRCRCSSPIFAQDNDTFECVRVRPDPLTLGAHCPNSTYCGEGATCTTGSKICKCRLGYGATSDTGCEMIHCSKDEYCHKRVSPVTICHNKGDKKQSFCGCKDGFCENPRTLECSPEAPNVGEKCAKEGGAFKLECGQFAACNANRKCECFGKDMNARRDLPWRCE